MSQKKKSLLGGRIVRWIHLRTPSFNPAAQGSNPKYNIYASSNQFQIVYKFCLRIVKRTEINKKEAGVGKVPKVFYEQKI